MLPDELDFALDPRRSGFVAALPRRLEDLLSLCQDGAREVAPLAQLICVEQQSEPAEARLERRRTFVLPADQPAPPHVREIAASAAGMRSVEVDEKPRFAADEDEVARRKVTVAHDFRFSGERRPRCGVEQAADEASGDDDLIVFPPPPFEVRRHPTVAKGQDFPTLFVETAKSRDRVDALRLEQPKQAKQAMLAASGSTSRNLPGPTWQH